MFLDNGPEAYRFPTNIRMVVVPVVEVRGRGDAHLRPIIPRRLVILQLRFKDALMVSIATL